MKTFIKNGITHYQIDQWIDIYPIICMNCGIERPSNAEGWFVELGHNHTCPGCQNHMTEKEFDKMWKE